MINSEVEYRSYVAVVDNLCYRGEFVGWFQLKYWNYVEARRIAVWHLHCSFRQRNLLRVFIGWFSNFCHICSASSLESCRKLFLQMIVPLLQNNFECPSVARICCQYSDFGHLFWLDSNVET